mgnify:FL=1
MAAGWTRRVEHLAGCKNCRIEAAAALKIVRACEEAFPEPDEAFARFEFPESKDAPEESTGAIETLTQAVEIVIDAFTITRKAVRLAQI